ncbi:MAG: tetratricopeptide repeat protein [Myxococcota bacterium]
MRQAAPPGRSSSLLALVLRTSVGAGSWAGVLALVGLTLASSSAQAQDLAAMGRAVTSIEGEARSLASAPIQRQNTLRSPTHVEERLTDGELFYRLQDYVRASIIFTDIVDNFTQHRAYPDALFLLADSLYRAGDYLGARTRFRMLLDRAAEPAFRPFIQRALGRLIEIAIHTRDFEGVEGYFAQLSRLPPTEVEAATNYFRAKYLYNRAVPTEDVIREREEGEAPPAIDVATLDQARTAFEAVPDGSPYYPQARYFVGVIYTLRGQYPQGIEAFRRVLRARATTAEQREVVELTQLALGRLYYETDQLDQAIEAYQAVPRTSSNFDVALYEIAWVYIRQGDSTRAERALEVLTVAAPDSRFIPDGKLLRGNLLLRNGRFDDSESVFREVRNQFGPVRRELDEMLEGQDDPLTFFRALVRDNMETFDANQFLPPLARRWASLEGDMDRALSVLSDLATCRQLVRETSDLIDRLNAALGSPNAVNVFADLRERRENTIALRNRIARVRRQLIDAEGRGGAGSPELTSIREERRQIERFLGRMPTDDDDFVVRNDQLLGRYRVLERELSDLQVELMGMDARVVATDRFIEDTREQQTDPAAVDATLSELETHRSAIEGYREELRELERTIELARLQVGVGDVRYQRDDRLRTTYAQLVERERAELARQGIRRPREIDTLFGRLAAVEGVLDRHDAAIDAVVRERVAEMMVVINEESENLVGYRQAIASLEVEAEEVIGGVTYQNFQDVRQRFYNLVLRADVGRIDVSWARREEHRMRVDLLTRERSREIQALDDEYQEIMDIQNSGAGGEE